MGIVFRQFAVLSAGFLVCVACGDAGTEDDTNGVPPPFSGSTSVLPAQPDGILAPSEDPDPVGAIDSTQASANPEAPPDDVPIVPSTPAGEGDPPPAEDPPPGRMTPPDTTPPQMGLPPEPPPAESRTRVCLL